MTSIYWKGLIITTMVGCFAVAQVVQSEDFDVTVEVDEATVSDGNLLGLYMSEMPSGEVVPRNMRGLAMQVAGEATYALYAQRVDGNGFVVLDDGTTVAQSEGDSLSAHLIDPFGNGAEAFVYFATFITPTGDSHIRPCSVTVCLPSGEHVGLGIPLPMGPPDTPPIRFCAFRNCAVP